MYAQDYFKRGRGGGGGGLWSFPRSALKIAKVTDEGCLWPVVNIDDSYLQRLSPDPNKPCPLVMHNCGFYTAGANPTFFSRGSRGIPNTKIR